MWTVEREIARRAQDIRSDSNASVSPAGSGLATTATISLFFLVLFLIVSFFFRSLSLSEISLFVENGDRSVDSLCWIFVYRCFFVGSLNYGCQPAPPPVPEKPVPSNSSFFDRKSFSGDISPEFSWLLSV